MNQINGNINNAAMPSGMGSPNGDQVNLPIAATLGIRTTANAQNIQAGNERSTAPGPAIFSWNKYDFMLNAYFSTGGFYDGTALVKSTIEKDDQYLERRGTCYYRNFVKPIVDATYTPVFSTSPTRKISVNGVNDEACEIIPIWGAFLKNVDARGCELQLFTEKVVRYSRILGVSFVVMDNFPINELPRLANDAIAERKFPFVYMRLPQQVENDLLRIDNFGNIDEIVFSEQPRFVHDASTNTIKEIPQWKKWTRNYSVMLERNDKTGKWNELSDTVVWYNFGKVPVIAVHSSEVDDNNVLPHPTYYDVARCNWALFNIDSAKMRLVRSQMFAMLCMSKVEGGVAASPVNGIELPANTPEQQYPLPFYLAPPTGPYSELTTTVQDIKEDLYRLANQQGVTGVQSAQSGISKAYDFQANSWVLKKSAQIAANVENKIAELFKLYVKSEKFDFKSCYRENYEPDSLNSEILEATDYLALDPGPVARSEALKKVSASYFRGIAPEVLEKIIADIDATIKDEQELPAGSDETHDDSADDYAALTPPAPQSKEKEQEPANAAQA